MPPPGHEGEFSTKKTNIRDALGSVRAPSSELSHRIIYL